MHGAPYVSEKLARSIVISEEAGAVLRYQKKLTRPIIDKIKDGSCLLSMPIIKIT